MNIKIAQLQTKPFDVKGTLKNLKKTYKFQLSMAKMQASFDGNDKEVDVSKLSDEEKEVFERKQNEEGIKNIETMLNMQDGAVDYLVDMLHLNAKMSEKIEDWERDDLFDISQYVAMRITGMSDEEIEEQKKEMRV